MAGLPALRRQHLLAEFAGLKQACPDGVFVSLTPGDPALWSGVIFVRQGPYSPAVVRFQISFPDTYPALPPFVTFSTDIFHPLITPLTTYMYTTDVQDNGTVSATDEERLPPGGFSLRHGFPEWFGRATRAGSRAASEQQQGVLQTPPRAKGAGSTNVTPDSASSAASTLARGALPQNTTYDVLRYIRTTFDDVGVLDAVPLKAAGNPGAWHAWRTHRRQEGTVFPDEETPESKDSAVGLDASEQARADDRPVTTTSSAVRRPGDWNWEGVWEERVKRGITASLSESVLYGNAGSGDELISFINMEENDVAAVKDNLLRTLGSTA